MGVTNYESVRELVVAGSLTRMCPNRFKIAADLVIGYYKIWSSDKLPFRDIGVDRMLWYGPWQAWKFGGLTIIPGLRRFPAF